MALKQLIVTILIKGGKKMNETSNVCGDPQTQDKDLILLELNQQINSLLGSSCDWLKKPLELLTLQNCYENFHFSSEPLQEDFAEKSRKDEGYRILEELKKNFDLLPCKIISEKDLLKYKEVINSLRELLTSWNEITQGQKFLNLSNTNILLSECRSLLSYKNMRLNRLDDLFSFIDNSKSHTSNKKHIQLQKHLSSQWNSFIKKDIKPIDIKSSKANSLWGYLKMMFLFSFHKVLYSV